MKFRQFAKSTPLPEQNYFTEIILFLALPNNLIIHVNILTCLDFHYLQQSLCPYRMKRAAWNPYRLPLSNSKLVAIQFHPTAPLDDRPRFIAPFVQMICERASRTERNLDRKALRLCVDDAELPLRFFCIHHRCMQTLHIGFHRTGTLLVRNKYALRTRCDDDILQSHT